MMLGEGDCWCRVPGRGIQMLSGEDERSERDRDLEVGSLCCHQARCAAHMFGCGTHRHVGGA